MDSGFRAAIFVVGVVVDEPHLASGRRIIDERKPSARLTIGLGAREAAPLTHAACSRSVLTHFLQSL